MQKELQVPIPGTGAAPVHHPLLPAKGLRQVQVPNARIPGMLKPPGPCQPMHNEPTGPSLTTTGAQTAPILTLRDLPTAMATRTGLIARITASPEPLLHPAIEMLFNPGVPHRAGLILNQVVPQTGLPLIIVRITHNKEAVLLTVVRAAHPVEAAAPTPVRAAPAEAVDLL